MMYRMDTLVHRRRYICSWRKQDSSWGGGRERGRVPCFLWILTVMRIRL